MYKMSPCQRTCIQGVVKETGYNSNERDELHPSLLLNYRSFAASASQPKRHRIAEQNWKFGPNAENRPTRGHVSQSQFLHLLACLGWCIGLYFHITLLHLNCPLVSLPAFLSISHFSFCRLFYVFAVLLVHDFYCTQSVLR
jgi:hypothetical protein